RPEAVGVDPAALHEAWFVALAQQRPGRCEEHGLQADVRPEVGQETAHATSGVPGAAEAGEDLPPDGEVPVSEGRPDGGRVGGPRAATQHPEPVPGLVEEDL